jgi:hypothetical protein
MHGMALGQYCSILFVKESIVKTESRFACERKHCLNVDYIIIARRAVVAAIGLINWKKTSALFQRSITATRPSEKLGAANFKPPQVISIICYSHGVGITI